MINIYITDGSCYVADVPMDIFAWVMADDFIPQDTFIMIRADDGQTAYLRKRYIVLFFEAD